MQPTYSALQKSLEKLASSLSMTEFEKVALFPAIIVGAWFWSRDSAVLARNVARSLSVFMAGVLACLIVTGGLHADRLAGRVHLWSGHGLTIAVWLAAPFAMGVVLQQSIRQRPVAAIVQCLGLLLLLGLTVLEGASGYLGPTHAIDIDEETYNRFIILHVYTFPGAIGAGLMCWFWLLRRGKAA